MTAPLPARKRRWKYRYAIAMVLPLIGYMFLIVSSDQIAKALTATMDTNDHGSFFQSVPHPKKHRLKMKSAPLVKDGIIKSKVSKSSDHSIASPELEIRSVGKEGAKKGGVDQRPKSTERNDEAISDRKKENDPKAVPFFLHQDMDSFYTNASKYFDDENDFEPNLWDDDPIIPQWMKVYLTWHRQERKRMKRIEDREYAKFNEGHWNFIRRLENATQHGTTVKQPEFYKPMLESSRVLVMQCIKADPKCGGTSDRLRTFLTIMRIAYETKRVLLICWDKPHPLERFLMPPRGGLDWRTPDWLRHTITTQTKGKVIFGFKTLQPFASKITQIVRSKVQSFDAGKECYNRMIDDAVSKGIDSPQADYNGIYERAWRMMFTPSPAIAEITKRELQRLKLVPGNYMGLHLRALYGQDKRRDSKLKFLAEQSANCSIASAPGRPIYMASDSPKAIRYAHDYTSYVMPEPLVWRVPNPDPPLHMEFGASHRAEDYYDTFVDLYLLSLGGCVTFGVGGYGKWAAFIGKSIENKCVYQVRAEDVCDLPPRSEMEARDENLMHASQYDYDSPIWVQPMPAVSRHAMMEEEFNVAGS